MDKKLYRKRYAKFAELLRHERLCHGRRITQEELAKEMGYTQEQISRIDAGHRRLDVIELMEYCRAADIDFVGLVSRLPDYLQAYSLWPCATKDIVKDRKEAIDEILRNVK